MPILEFDDGKGGKVTAIVCGRGLKTCGWCNRISTKLCDFPTGAQGKTCDARMCDSHSTHAAKDTDYCPTPH